MTIYSDEIKDFLDKIYFYELSHRDDILTPMFNYFREKLRNIDKLPTHRPLVLQLFILLKCFLYLVNINTFIIYKLTNFLNMMG